MTGEKYDSEDVRTQINNIKRADYRKTWKVEDRKKKKATNSKAYQNTVDINDPVNTPIFTPLIYCVFSTNAKFPTKRLIVKPIPVNTPTP